MITHEEALKTLLDYIRDIMVSGKSDITFESIIEAKKILKSALNQAKQLERDVKRYFELQNMWNWKQRKEWNDELDTEYANLREKLSKVGHGE